MLLPSHFFWHHYGLSRLPHKLLSLFQGSIRPSTTPCHLATFWTMFLGFPLPLFKLQPLISNTHNFEFTMALDSSVWAPHGSLPGLYTGPSQTLASPATTQWPQGTPTLSPSALKPAATSWLLMHSEHFKMISTPYCKHIYSLRIVHRSSNTPFSAQQCLFPD